VGIFNHNLNQWLIQNLTSCLMMNEPIFSVISTDVVEEYQSTKVSIAKHFYFLGFLVQMQKRLLTS
jgi:hypothetical protein